MPSQNNGFQKGGTPWGEFNQVSFIIKQAIAKMQTVTLVRVDAVSNAGELAPVGSVDVTPLVNQRVGDGTTVPHTTIHNVPYFRLQGGTDAIIIDPKVGDIGICCFASRDISTVKRTKKQSPPGSNRRYSFADGLYIGGLLNGTPEQYVRFAADGITMHSPTKITLDAPVIEVNGGDSVTVNTPIFTVNGATMLNGPLNQGNGAAGGDAHMRGPLYVVNNIEGDSDIIAQLISLLTHQHTGVQTGGSNTGGPV